MRNVGFDYPHLFETVTCQVYGKTESIQVMTLTLLWRPIADYVLFVLAVTSKGPIILMSSDLELWAVNAIELYCARTRIEILFSVLKQVIGAFKFRFWIKEMDPFFLSRTQVTNKRRIGWNRPRFHSELRTLSGPITQYWP